MESTSMVKAQFFKPHPALQPYIATYVFSSITATDYFQIDLFPIGQSVLSFSIDERPVQIVGNKEVFSNFNLTGQLTRYHHISLRGEYNYVYAVFKPTGVYAIMHFPQNEVTDEFVSVNDLLGSEIRIVEERMKDCSNDLAGIVSILDQWLLNCLFSKKINSKLEAIEFAVQHINATKGSSSIKDLCRHTSLSKSTLERHFHEVIGMRPKLYSRIIRFNQAYHALLHSKVVDWQEIVFTYNFFDQAHFIKDFRHFFNTTPSDLHKSKLNGVNIIGADK